MGNVKIYMDIHLNRKHEMFLNTKAIPDKNNKVKGLTVNMKCF